MPSPVLVDPGFYLEMPSTIPTSPKFDSLNGFDFLKKRHNVSIWWCPLQCHPMEELIQLSRCIEHISTGEESSGIVGKTMVIFILRQQHFYYILEQMILMINQCCQMDFTMLIKNKLPEDLSRLIFFQAPALCVMESKQRLPLLSSWAGCRELYSLNTS